MEKRIFKKYLACFLCVAILCGSSEFSSMAQSVTKAESQSGEGDTMSDDNSPEIVSEETSTVYTESSWLNEISLAKDVVSKDSDTYVKLYYDVEKSSTGSIAVYQEDGTLVRSLYDKVSHSPMYYYLGWDMKDETGVYVENGNYNIQLDFFAGNEKIRKTISVTITGDSILSDVSFAETLVNVGNGELVKLYYDVTKNGNGTIIVYNASGAKVKVIYNSVYHSAGYYLATWNGKDDSGRHMPSGTYTIKLDFGTSHCEVDVQIISDGGITLSNVSVANANVSLGETVRIYYEIDKAAKGNIAVYNANGEEVYRIYDDVQHSAGYYLATWAGIDKNGHQVAGGNYTIKIWFGSSEQSVNVKIISDSVLERVSLADDSVDIKKDEEVRLYYSVETTCSGSIKIYDNEGNLVKTIYENVPHSAMYYLATWNGKNDAGKKVDEGKYIIRLIFGGDIREVTVNILNDTEKINLVLDELKIVPEVVSQDAEEVRIYYNISHASQGTIGVYDANGKLIKSIYNNVTHSKGYYYAFWNLKDDTNKLVDPGVYTVKLKFETSGEVVEKVLDVTVEKTGILSNIYADENSFNISSTDVAKFYYSVSTNCTGSIIIYDQSGNKIKTVYDNVKHVAGGYLATWNMENDAGSRVPDGKYTIKFLFKNSSSITDEEILNVTMVKELAVNNVKFTKPIIGIDADRATIFYSVTEDCVGNIEIYNESGSKIYTLYDDVNHAAGYYSAYWLLIDSSGNKVDVGTYTFKLTFRDGTVVKTAKAELVIEEERKSVWIDAGHGGTDVGAVNGRRYERDDNLRLALELQRVLLQQGVEVYMSRVDIDANYSAAGLVSLKERVQKANEAEVDIFVSLHRDSSTSSAARGYTVYTHNSNNSANYNENAYPDKNSGCVLLADALNNALGKANTFKSRGVVYGSAGSTQDLLVNRVSNMPSCLLEMGFISNSSDNVIFDTYLKENAKSIAKGIMNYFDLGFDEAVYTTQ